MCFARIVRAGQMFIPRCIDSYTVAAFGVLKPGGSNVAMSIWMTVMSTSWIQNPTETAGFIFQQSFQLIWKSTTMLSPGASRTGNTSSPAAGEAYAHQARFLQTSAAYGFQPG